MSESFFKEMPRFKNPEEELNFLRAHVAKKEQELIDKGHFENTQEKAAQNVLAEYKEMPIGKGHKDIVLNKKETESIVLKLKPETHDTVMEELLGIVLTNGIKNAMSVVEAMNNPHIDDDFNRLLVQYLRTGKILPGLKEGTPLYKSLDMTLFEVTLPPPQDEAEKQKSFKDFISAMEQFYAGMQSISEGADNKKENYFTLEVALDNQTDLCRRAEQTSFAF